MMRESDGTTNGGDFSARLIDQFFRRWFFFVLPVIVFAAVGVRSSGNVSEEYETRGTLSASSNPLVESPEVRGSTIGAFESPAAGIARLINEQLRSDAFVETVAERAGLDQALSDEIITTDVIRQQVGAGAQGENLLAVRASWGDPETAYLLVDATINSYLDLLAETVAIDSLEAITFWSAVRSEAQARADTAESELRDYIQTLPVLAEGEQLSTVQELDVARLNATLDAALSQVSDAQSRIDTAELNVEQSKSEAGRQVRVVDPPQRATAPTPETFRKLATVAMFTMMGLLLGLAALVVTTMVDHSIRSISQLRSATGMSSTVVVPRSKALRNWPPSDEQAA
jgi:hypothetical protein